MKHKHDLSRSVCDGRRTLTSVKDAKAYNRNSSQNSHWGSRHVILQMLCSAERSNMTFVGAIGDIMNEERPKVGTKKRLISAWGN